MTNDTLAKLAACPFCGSAAEICTLQGEDGDAGIGAQYVCCTNSSCSSSSALVYPLMDDVTALLAERWNRRALAAQALPAAEPFGYFKAEPMGWTDCAETDEGAVALYERPQQAATPKAALVAEFGERMDGYSEGFDDGKGVGERQAAQATAAPKLDTDTLRPLVARLALEIDPEAVLETLPEALAFQIDMARAVIRAALPQPQPQSAQSKGDAA